MSGEGGGLIEVLTAENDVLRERVAALEALLYGADNAPHAPIEWGLTQAEIRIFCALVARERASKEHLLHAIHGARPDDPPDIKIVDVFVCKMRKKLTPFGVPLHTLWGFGYQIAPEWKAAFLAGNSDS